MNFSEKGTPAPAIVAALSTLACYLPLGFIGAVEGEAYFFRGDLGPHGG